ELSVDDHQPSAWPQHAHPFVDRGFGMRQRPEQMAAGHEVEARGREREVLGVAFLEPDRDRLRRRLAPRFGDHRGREVDGGHLVPSPDELEAQEAGAAADVERVERTTAGEDEVQDAIPGGAFGGRADAVTEVLVESRSAAVPVRRDLLLDGIDHRRLYSALT